MALKKYPKQPAEVLDYDFNFTRWFKGKTDSISTWTYTIDPGISVITQVRSGNVIKLVVAGGTSGQTYKLTVRMTSVAGLVKEKEILIVVKEL